MAALSKGTRRILSGESIPIKQIDPPEIWDVDFWAMAQPDDWLWDDAQMEYDAAYYRALASDSLKRIATLPPSDEWIEEHEQTQKALQASIDLLTSVRDEAAEQRERDGDEGDPQPTIGLTTDQAYELQLSINLFEGNAEQAQTFSKAKELAQRRADTARAMYLIPRLLVDQDGMPLIDIETDEGRSLWAKVSRYQKATLRAYLNEVIWLVSLAKN